MCLEDVRLGRKKRTAVTVIPWPSGSSSEVLPFNALRTNIMIFANTPGFFIAPAPIDASLPNVAQIPTNFPYLEFNIERHGDVVTKQWNGFANLIGNSLLVIETFLMVE